MLIKLNQNIFIPGNVLGRYNHRDADYDVFVQVQPQLLFVSRLLFSGKVINSPDHAYKLHDIYTFSRIYHDYLKEDRKVAWQFLSSVPLTSYPEVSADYVN